MVAMLIWTDNVDSLVAAFETVFDERKKHVIPFIVASEERAYMAYVVELRAGEWNGRRCYLHAVPHLSSATPSVTRNTRETLRIRNESVVSSFGLGRRGPNRCGMTCIPHPTSQINVPA